MLRKIYRLVVRRLGPVLWQTRRRLGWRSKYGLVAQDVSVFLGNLEKFRNLNAKVTILDLGSRHGLEAIKFVERYPNATVYCFEANPQALTELVQNVSRFPQITVVPKAINSFNGECDFYAIDSKKTITPWNDGNLGASSLFLARQDVRLGGGERYVQNQIRVPCTRLDSFLAYEGIAQVDAIWMDLQGAELIALQSLPESIFENLAVIQTELESQELYLGQGLMAETAEFLSARGMTLTAVTPHGEIAGDYVFINSRLLQSEMRAKPPGNPIQS
jgi:FkbM family methyltransferase